MLTPLTRLIDAARPDSQAARRFASMVDGLLSDAPHFHRNRDSIRVVLTQWRDVRPALDIMIDKAPVLREAEQLPRDLSEIGAVGLEALSYVAAGLAPPDGWRDAKLAMLAEAAKPKAEVEFAMLEPVKKLIILADVKPTLKNIPHSEWKGRVLTVSAEKSR
jgi:hexosaminidase